MKAVIMQQTIAANDAISKDVTGMLSALEDRAECRVYCDYSFLPGVHSISKNEYEDTVSDSANLLIYHHSFYWKAGDDLLKRAKCRIAFKYHNVTPPEYFRNYNEKYHRFCSLGMDQTDRFLKGYPEAFWIGDSEFNISGLSGARTEVCPPFNGLNELGSVVPDDRLLERLKKDKRIKLLFVGRYAPNKGHKFLIDVVKNYISKYGDNICLYMVGKKDRHLELYLKELDFLVKSQRLSGNIKMIGDINSARLVSYYRGCDFFICASSHEGFCMPVIEAQYFGLPVIVRRSSALPDTAGADQVLLSDDSAEYAAAVKLLSDKPDLRNYLVDNGFKNFMIRFDNTTIKARFLDIISGFAGVDL